MAISGYEFLRKDRCDAIEKAGGGVILYYRNSLICQHKKDLEISNTETLWSEVTLPKSNPFLLCTIYRPPNVNSNWIDAFEEELSIAQTTGLEIIVMGDLNIDLLNCSNRKWLSLIQLFDLKQLISDPTRIRNKTSTLTDHLHCSNPENISDCLVSHYSISDHFPICFSRKINSKVKKTTYTSPSYRCFKNFNKELFFIRFSTQF